MSAGAGAGRAAEGGALGRTLMPGARSQPPLASFVPHGRSSAERTSRKLGFAAVGGVITQTRAPVENSHTCLARDGHEIKMRACALKCGMRMVLELERLHWPDASRLQKRTASMQGHNPCTPRCLPGVSGPRARSLRPKFLALCLAARS
mgnify:CR=1 FL=1